MRRRILQVRSRSRETTGNEVVTESRKELRNMSPALPWGFICVVFPLIWQKWMLHVFAPRNTSFSYLYICSIVQ